MSSLWNRPGRSSKRNHLMNKTGKQSPGRIKVTASPSLALLKYWGKLKTGVNIPATSSIAVTLSGLETRTEISISPIPAVKDQLILNGNPVDDPKIRSFLHHARSQYHLPESLTIQSTNNFPTSAGLASSSSGFAALAAGLSVWIDPSLNPAELSALARTGSGSAARAVFGGWTHWPRGSSSAIPLYLPDYWEDLRIVLILVTSAPKPEGSRSAMNHCSETSPFFPVWTQTNENHEKLMLDALKRKDLELLGTAMQQSYLSMFSTMFTASPPVFYWLPKTVQILRACADLRRQGFNVWETMDAGPQVKLFCLEKELKEIVSAVSNQIENLEYRVSCPGNAPTIEIFDE